MRVAERWFEHETVGDGIVRITEPHVDPFLQANLYLVRGRDRDVLIDAGLGLGSLTDELPELFERRVLAVATHRHFDHVGGLHEFGAVAVHRQDEDLKPNEPLIAGDTMLLQGTWAALDERLAPPEVLVVNSPDLIRRQALPMGPGAKQTLLVLAGMVLLLATGIVPAAVAGLLAAGAVVLLGVLSIDEVYRAVDWTTVILVGAMMPLSTAISETGAAQMLAEGLISVVGPAGPRALLAGLFVLTAVLGQVISNTATALIIIPISVVAALEMGVSPQPVLMSVAVAAAAAFLTPVATPTNLMVMEPGSYRFGDYWKFGLPFMAWFFVIAVGLVPVIWPF